jgi:hypothetical protein
VSAEAGEGGEIVLRRGVVEEVPMAQKVEFLKALAMAISWFFLAQEVLVLRQLDMY